MTLIDLLKLMPDELRVVIWENPRRKFPLNGTVEEVIDECTLEMLEAPVMEINRSMMYDAIGIEIE